MKSALLCLVSVFAGLLAACSSSGNSSQPTLTSIAISPANPSVAAGLPQAFTAKGMFSNGTSQDVTGTAMWASSDTTVATIVAGGAATTLKQGTTSISATVGSVSGKTTLTVTAPVLESVAVTPADASVPIGTLTQFTATGTLSDGSTQDLTATATWMSSNMADATFGAGGLLTALAITNAPITITATSSDGTVSGNTSLSVVTATLMSITISGTPPPDPDVTIAVGTSFPFTALGLYNDGSRRNITGSVTWASSNPAVATIVPTNGRAQGVGVGSTMISATLGSVSGNVTLNVSTATIQSIVVGPAGAAIAPPATQAFTAIGVFSDASTQNITHDVMWASDTPDVATVSNTSGSIGVATAVSAGTASISATLQGITGAAPLIVSAATLTSITLKPTSAGLAVDSTLPVQAVGNFSDGTTRQVGAIGTWLSTDTGVATVSAPGVVTGVSAGSAAVTCQVGSVVSNPADLTVESVTGIAITPTSPLVAAGTSINLLATGTLADGSTQNLTTSVQWTSTNSSVLTMSSSLGAPGIAIGNAPGTVTVTAAFSGIVATVSVTVSNATLNSIAVTPANKNIALGTSQQFTATGTFSDGSTEILNTQVAWSSSDLNVAIISDTGGALTVGTGTTTIGATLAGVSGTTGLQVH